MIFVVETGVGRPDANAYTTITLARRYASDRHLDTLLDLTDDALKAVLIRATDYIDQRWQQDFIGIKKTSTQALAWPRDDAYDERGELFPDIPTSLQKATIELASRAKGLQALLPDPPSPYPVADTDGASADVASGQLVSVRQRVGDIETAKTYSGSIGGVTQPVTWKTLAGVSVQSFPAVDLLLAPLLIGGGRGNAVIRY